MMTFDTFDIATEIIL